MDKQTALIGEYVPPFIPFEIKRKPDTLYCLSFGAGVNSVAMIIKLIELKAPLDYIIFADTGAEKPETMAYIQYFTKAYLEKNNRKIITVKSTRGSLVEISESNHVIPRPASTRRRWCTIESKIVPIKRAARLFMKKEKYHKVVQYIGFASDEGHRIQERGARDPKYVEKCYPLTDLKITRQICKDIIKKQGLFEPVKSGCYFCQFQSKSEWQKLYDQHPDLYAESVRFEKQAHNKKTGAPEFFNHVKGKPISLEKLAESFKNQKKIKWDGTLTNVAESDKIVFDEKKYASCPQGCFGI